MFGFDHRVLEARHQKLHEMAREQVEKRDVTTINGQIFSVQYVTAAQPTGNGGGIVLGGDSQTSTDDSDYSTPVRSLIPPASVSRNIQTASDSGSYPTAASSANYATQTNYNTQTAAASSRQGYYGTSTGSSVASTGTAGASNGSTNAQSSDAGLSTAGKAGLAIGGILAIGAILGIILFLISKKKKQRKAEEARQDSEKTAAAAAASRSPQTAPRLSFRPASSFMPEFMGRPKSRLSGNLLGGSSNDNNAIKERYMASSTAGQQQAIPMTEKVSPTENPFRDPENPFADPLRGGHQYPSQSPQYPQVMHAPPPSQAPAPVSRHLEMPEPHNPPRSIGMASPVPSMNSYDAAIAGARAQSNGPQPTYADHSHHHNEPIEMPTPPVGVPAPLTTQRSAAPPADNGPPGESTVYRILMDFTPSMEDELELRAGQVVRMLHEYDDGWCLCTRLDRSSQGVVPRTCLAAKPSKPRPAPGQGSRPMSPAMGPPGHHGRPMTPAMRGPPQGRPMSPGMGRPMSPANAQRRPMSPGPRGQPPSSQPGSRPMSPGAYNQSPRPLSPGPRSSKRSQSPGPYGSAGGPAPMAQQRRRSNSSSQAARDVRDRRQSPPGPSPLGGAGIGLGMAI